MPCTTKKNDDSPPANDCFAAQDDTGEGGAVDCHAGGVGAEVPERDQTAGDPLRPQAGQHPPHRGQRLRRDQDHRLRPQQGHGRGELQPRPRHGSHLARGRHILVNTSIKKKNYPKTFFLTTRKLFLQVSLFIKRIKSKDT